MSRDGRLDRLLRALNHPVRRRILRQLLDGPASASVMARSFKMDLGVVSYHLNQVLHRQCEVIELVEAVPRRGSVEKIYRVRADSSGCLLRAVEAMEGEA